MTKQKRKENPYRNSLLQKYPVHHFNVFRSSFYFFNVTNKPKGSKGKKPRSTLPQRGGRDTHRHSADRRESAMHRWTHTHAHTSAATGTLAHTQTRTWTHTHKHSYMHTHIEQNIHTRTHTHSDTRMNTHTHVRASACTQAHAHTHTHTVTRA